MFGQISRTKFVEFFIKCTKFGEIFHFREYGKTHFRFNSSVTGTLLLVLVDEAMSIAVKMTDLNREKL